MSAVDQLQPQHMWHAAVSSNCSSVCLPQTLLIQPLHMYCSMYCCSSCRLRALTAELGRVQAAETSTLSGLRDQEEALLRLANQLKEAAHSEISSLQATEGRLVAVVEHSTQRLKSMQVCALVVVESFSMLCCRCFVALLVPEPCGLHWSVLL